VLSGDFDVIKDNLVSDSATNGIHVRNSSSVEGNTVVGNNVTQDVGAAGILVAGDYNSVTANHATQNTFADILVTGNHSLVTGNSISNGIFVSSGSGFNVIGPRVDYANITTNTNPDANFTHWFGAPSGGDPRATHIGGRLRQQSRYRAVYDEEFVDLADEFGPSGLAFNSPVTAVFHYGNGDIPSGVQPENLRVYVLQDGVWDFVGGTVDTVAMTLTVQLSHFSTYGAFAQLSAPVSVGGIAEQPDVSALPPATSSSGRDYTPYILGAAVAFLATAGAAGWRRQRGWSVATGALRLGWDIGKQML
jgi:Periplasmic copper-binding protein (NosD)